MRGTPCVRARPPGQPAVAAANESRRALLRYAAGAVAACASGALGVALTACESEEVLERRGPARRVIVVGAGLAGLSAAYELTRAGHDVVVLEAQSRPGGRVLTFREPLADGLWAEAGAARIADGHALTLRYVRQFGLPLEPFYPADGLLVGWLDGQRRHLQWRAFADAVQAQVGSHLDGEWHGIRLNGRARWSRIRGGNDLLPRAFAVQLGARVIYASPVRRIEQESQGVRVHFAQRGTMHSMQADRVVCAVPFPVLRHIEVAPAWSAPKRAVIEDLAYAMAARMCVQTRSRFWQARGENGFAITDWPAEIWQPSLHQAGTRGLLQIYLRHTQAIQMLAHGEGGRIEVALDRLEEVFPGARASVERVVEKYWCQDRWAGGAYSAPAPGQAVAAAAVEGRIHFAGEHTSASGNAWMQGALESGRRAAREVNAAGA